MFAAAEALGWALLRYRLEPAGAAYVSWTPSQESFQGYLDARDPELGWTNLGTARDLEATGARELPGFDPDERPCVALFGDSFTYGSEVEAGDAWGAELARRLGCRTANFGVGGYGADQAYLRWRRLRERNPDADAPIVILGHLTENVMRHVNRFRALLYPRQPLMLKPRFVLDEGGGLRLIEAPAPATLGEYGAIARGEAAALAHEHFLPGGPSGPAVHGFPYSVNAIRALASPRMAPAFGGAPMHAPLYRDDHPSQALGITLEIFSSFAREVHALGAAPVIVVIAYGPDMRAFRGADRWIHAPLVEAARARGLTVIDAGPAMMAKLGAEEDPCALFFDCDQHFNPRGYRLLGEVVAEALLADPELAARLSAR